METYNKANKGQPFNWNKFLNRKESTISEREWTKAKKLAGNWVTCACGNQCSILDRDDQGEPLDNLLSTLGCDFYQDIAGRDIKTAKHTLKQIERRSAELIKEKIQEMVPILRAAGYKVIK